MKMRTLAGIQGCNTEEIGTVPAWTGLPQLVLIPRVPQAMKRLDARLLVAFGLALFAASDFANVDLSDATDADQAVLAERRAVGRAGAAMRRAAWPRRSRRSPRRCRGAAPASPAVGKSEPP